MRKDVYVCDLCGCETTRDKVAAINVSSVEGLKIKSANRYVAPVLHLDVCHECLEEKGFVITPKTEEERQTQEKTNAERLKDKLLDLLLEAGVQFEG